MAPTRLRYLVTLVAAVFSLPSSSFAFETPLSDTAVREAYFLGQRRDEKMAQFLDKYTVYLAPPKSGPHIASITMFTPYARLYSSLAIIPPAIARSRPHSTMPNTPNRSRSSSKSF